MLSLLKNYRLIWISWLKNGIYEPKGPYICLFNQRDHPYITWVRYQLIHKKQKLRHLKHKNAMLQNSAVKPKGPSIHNQSDHPYTTQIQLRRK